VFRFRHSGFVPKYRRNAPIFRSGEKAGATANGGAREQNVLLFAARGAARKALRLVDRATIFMRALRACLKRASRPAVKIRQNRPAYCVLTGPAPAAGFNAARSGPSQRGTGRVNALRFVAYACGVERFTCFSRL